MKRVNNIYEQICDIGNLRLADHLAARGKSHQYGVQLHRKNQEQGLMILQNSTSSSAIYNAYIRCLRSLSDGQKFTILYFGDHDPSGLDMIRDIRERLEYMLSRGRFEYGRNIIDDYFEVIPIGLTMEQIKKYKLPPNPTKLTDTRSNGYIKKFGKTCWEVDALKPQVLTSLVESHVEEQIDMDLYNQSMAQEAEDLEKLQSFIDTRE